MGDVWVGRGKMLPLCISSHTGTALGESVMFRVLRLKTSVIVMPSLGRLGGEARRGSA